MKQLTLVVAGAIASCVSGLSVVTSKSSDAKKKKLLAQVELLPVTTSHLPLALVQTHAHTHTKMIRNIPPIVL